MSGLTSALSVMNVSQWTSASRYDKTIPYRPTTTLCRLKEYKIILFDHSIYCPRCCNISITGYVMYGFESVAQWHAESNSSIAVHIPRYIKIIPRY